MSQQQTLTGETAPKTHLMAQRPDDSPSNFGTLKSREWWCRDCHNRVTVAPDHDQEYGHELDCPHSCATEVSA